MEAHTHSHVIRTRNARRVREKETKNQRHVSCWNDEQTDCCRSRCDAGEFNFDLVWVSQSRRIVDFKQRKIQCEWMKVTRMHWNANAFFYIFVQLRWNSVLSFDEKNIFSHRRRQFRSLKFQKAKKMPKSALLCSLTVLFVSDRTENVVNLPNEFKKNLAKKRCKLSLELCDKRLLFSVCVETAIAVSSNIVQLQLSQRIKCIQWQNSTQSICDAIVCRQFNETVCELRKKVVDATWCYKRIK